MGRGLKLCPNTLPKKLEREVFDSTDRWALAGGVVMQPDKPLTSEQREVREVVGVFDTLDRLQSTIDDLMVGGFDHAQISLLASEEAVLEKLGPESLPASKLEDNPAAPRTEYVSPESRDKAKAALVGGLFYLGAAGAAWAVLASGGAMAAAITGGSGGLLGAALAGLIGRREATWTEEQLKHGGLLLWARPWDDEHERSAIYILQRHGGHDVHAHAFTA